MIKNSLFKAYTSEVQVAFVLMAVENLFRKKLRYLRQLPVQFSLNQVHLKVSNTRLDFLVQNRRAVKPRYRFSIVFSEGNDSWSVGSFSYYRGVPTNRYVLTSSPYRLQDFINCALVVPETKHSIVISGLYEFMSNLGCEKDFEETLSQLLQANSNGYL
jgi:hypothetical protein